MKNFYLTALIFVGVFMSAQVNISFESSEGYTLGNLHDQNGWEVTESSSGIIQNQTVSDEQASDGSYSFKNGFEPDFDFQWFPIFGGALTFDTPITNNQEFSFSYDVMVTGKNGADFEFSMFGINASDEFAPIAGVGIENRGYIYLIKDDSYDFDYAEASWEANEWVNIKVEVTTTEIKYYVNNVLETSIAKFNDIDVVGINFLHNNYGQDGYYDNLVFTMDNMGVSDLILNKHLNIYPNPVIDIVKISLENETVSSIQVYDMTGRLVADNKGMQEINLAKLIAGNYIIQIISETGAKFSKKVIKK